MGHVQGPLEAGFRLRLLCPALPQEQDASETTNFRASAWSSISSKVIAAPPSVDEAYRRRCRICRYRQSAYIPQRASKGKQAVVQARGAEDVAPRIRPGQPLAFLALPLVFCPCYKTFGTGHV
jgi:hypothetical protein